MTTWRELEMLANRDDPTESLTGHATGPPLGYSSTQRVTDGLSRSADCLLRNGENLGRPAEVFQHGSESTEDTVRRLDSEFDQMLADMKPHVLRLPHKSERQRCALWIKKFCEPPATGITGRKNRNMYAHLLIQMMKRGALDGPFTAQPGDGPLPTLLSYMSHYDGPNKQNLGNGVPSWVMGELNSDVSSLSLGSSITQLPTHMNLGSTSTTAMANAPGDATEAQHRLGMRFSADQLDGDSFKLNGKHINPGLADMPKKSSWQSGFGSSLSTSRDSSSTFRDDSTLVKHQERELDMKTKMLEAKFQEDKLKLQQKHDSTVQKILDRKNCELEELKGHYRSKYKEQEEAMSRLEKKVQTLQQELTHSGQVKDEQIEELKRVAEESSKVKQQEYEKKIHEAVSQLEQEKYDIQKQHTSNIQALLDDTNTRLQKMEEEYCAQSHNTSLVVKELESRITQLTKEAEATSVIKHQLEEEKKELQGKIEAQLQEIHEQHTRCFLLEQEQEKLQESHDQQIETIKAKLEADIQFQKQEHNLAVMKVKSLQKEIEQKEKENQKKAKMMEHTLQEKDAELSQLLKQNKHQMMQSEQALLEFKSQVEANSAKVFSDMKQQMEKVEIDLNRSKELREKQTQEYHHHIKELEEQSEQRIVELRVTHDAEKTSLVQDLHREKEMILQQKLAELTEQRKTHLAELKQHQQQAKAQHAKDRKVMHDLEQKMTSLQEQVEQSNTLRKQQLQELGRLREEERYKMQQEYDAQMLKCKAESEQQRLGEEKKHSSELEEMLHKTNERLKEIEREYAQRSLKSTEAIGELQRTMQNMTEDHQKSLEQAKAKHKQQIQQIEDEKKRMRQQQAQAYMNLQEELERQKSSVRQQERQKAQQAQDTEEQLSALRLEYEQRMRGLLPAESRQELEETISSLKTQVQTLQHRLSGLNTGTHQQQQQQHHNTNNNHLTQQHHATIQQLRQRQIQKDVQNRDQTSTTSTSQYQQSGHHQQTPTTTTATVHHPQHHQAHQHQQPTGTTNRGDMEGTAGMMILDEFTAMKPTSRTSSIDSGEQQHLHTHHQHQQQYAAC